MEALQLRRDSGKSLHYQIYTEIKTQILRGAVSPGELLPSYRFMSRKYSINVSTVEKAYDMLEANQYIQKRHGSGCYVLPLDCLEFYSDSVMMDSFESGQTEHGQVIDFASSTPVNGAEETQRFAGLIQELAREKPEELLRRPPTKGMPALRAEICKEFQRRNTPVPIEDLHIINGCQQGINLICQSIVGKNTVALVDDPSYSVATNSLQRAGAQIKTIPIEEDGPDIAAIEAVLGRTAVDFYYTIPAFHCPTNVTFSPDKRKAILELSKQHGFTVIEDDCLGELYFDGCARSTLWQPEVSEQVIYMTSFSKCLAPGLRLGYMVSSERFKRRLTLAKFNTDVASPAILQEALARYMSEGYYGRHLLRMRAEYASKRALMRGAIESSENLRLTYHNETGGAFFWVRLPEQVNGLDLWACLRRQGVKVIPGVACSTDERWRNYIRLSYVGPDDAMIKEGISQIDREVERMTQA